MRSISSAAWLSHDNIHDRPAVESIRDAVSKIRGVESILSVKARWRSLFPRTVGGAAATVQSSPKSDPTIQIGVRR